MASTKLQYLVHGDQYNHQHLATSNEYDTHSLDRSRRARLQAHEYLPSYTQLVSTPPTVWKFSPAKSNANANQSHQQHRPQRSELQPSTHLDDFVGLISQIYPQTIDDGDVDYSALADQYLDLSAHCPIDMTLPSRCSSPSTDSTHVSEVADSEFEYTTYGRRRGVDWDAPRLPRRRDSNGEYEPCLQFRQIGISPFHHRSSTGNRKEPNLLPRPPRDNTVPPSHPELKFTESRRDGRSKRQALACLFCRARKISCGRPPDGSDDQTCNQCARRRIECVYPTESRRGQHSRLKSLARKAEQAQNAMYLPSP
ncbi:hypothetical protein C8J57DRAFT_1337557 [Mycena rebaudengoi]|nr:hypothetical protein C8J57DRAFT_1337557 [Mycena rebaudengoi]